MILMIFLTYNNRSLILCIYFNDPPCGPVVASFQQNGIIVNLQRLLWEMRILISLRSHVIAISFAPCVVLKSELHKLRMRKTNISKAVPLDVVPERRTERCSPRFRPGDRFCELSFRYQSSPTGREGEKCRPLDHM